MPPKRTQHIPQLTRKRTPRNDHTQHTDLHHRLPPIYRCRILERLPHHHRNQRRCKTERAREPQPEDGVPLLLLIPITQKDEEDEADEEENCGDGGKGVERVPLQRFGDLD